MGGVESPGSHRDDALESLCAQMAIDAYRRIKLVPEAYDSDSGKAALAAEAFHEFDTITRRLRLKFRRLAF
jgi:hypothetical protein